MIAVLAGVGLTQSAIAKVMETERLLCSGARVGVLSGHATLLAQLGDRESLPGNRPGSGRSQPGSDTGPPQPHQL